MLAICFCFQQIKNLKTTKTNLICSIKLEEEKNTKTVEYKELGGFNY